MEIEERMQQEYGKIQYLLFSNEDLQGDQIHLIMNAIDVARKFKR